jgi:hypothetical protein
MPLNQDPAFWAAVGAGLTSGNTVGGQVGGLAQALAQYQTLQQGKIKEAQDKSIATDAKNKTLAYLKTAAPEYAAAVEAGALTANDALSMHIKAAEPKRSFQTLPNGDYGFVDERSGKFQTLGNAAKPINPMDNLKEVGGRLVGATSDGKIGTVYDPGPDPQDAAKEKAQGFSQELDTMKAYRQENPVQTYQVVHNAYQKARSSAPLKTAAGDMSLIYSFMKMNDPTSVVREGEFATAQNSGGVSDTVINAYNKALSGQMLNDDQRKMFLEAADKQYQNSVQNLEDANKQYSGLAKEYNVPTERFLLNPEKFPPLTVGGPPVDVQIGGQKATIEKMGD